jgi:hypothetical protein
MSRMAELHADLWADTPACANCGEEFRARAPGVTQDYRAQWHCPACSALPRCEECDCASATVRNRISEWAHWMSPRPLEPWLLCDNCADDYAQRQAERDAENSP